MGAEGLFSVAGRTALVTGGARGIGRMIARGFVAAGATVYVTSRSAADGAEAEAALTGGDDQGAGGRCVALVADLATEEGCRDLALAVAEREDRLDILVNNAGVMGGMGMAQHSQAVWEEVLAVNVQAVFFLTRELLPLLKAAVVDGEPARVINIGSVDGSTTIDAEIFPYSASKAAVHHLTGHLAHRLAPEVTVNALAPGRFETRMTEDVFRPYGDAIARALPLRRLGRPEDLVGAALYLAGRAGAYLTGAVIPVDGGAWMG